MVTMLEKNRDDTEIIIINQKLENFGERIKNTEELRNSKKSKAVVVELDTWIEYLKNTAELTLPSLKRIKSDASKGMDLADLLRILY